LSEFGIEVPPEKKYDIDYLLRQTVHIPIHFGPARGRPRNAEPLLRLLDTTTIVRDYEDVAGMTLDKIAQIEHPTLVVYGKKSHFLVTYEYLKEHLRHCRTVLIPDGEHYGPLEQPDLHAEHLREFLLSKDALGLLPAGELSAVDALKEACHE
jgi:pimeloyl-ACP methyl ester carboxylesterase